MKLLPALLLCPLLLFGSDAPGSDKPLNGEGYVYFGGICERHDGCYAQLVGGGGDFFLYRGLYAGADIGYFYPPSSPTNGLARGFVNVGYGFTNRRSPGWVVPFGEFGLGGYFRSGGVGMVKLGGGATVWFARHFGVRGGVFWERPMRSDYYGYNGASLMIGLSIR